MTSTGGGTGRDNYWEAVWCVPEEVLAGEDPEKVRETLGCWPDTNYSKEFELASPKLAAVVFAAEESPYYVGSLEEFPEMANWVARTTLKGMINVDGNNW